MFRLMFKKGLLATLIALGMLCPSVVFSPVTFAQGINAEIDMDAMVQYPTPEEALDKAREEMGVQEPAEVEPAKTKITWIGHAGFKIVTPAGRVLMIDPWLLNPKNPNGNEQLGALNKTDNKVDLVLVSHGHFDHVGNAVEIGIQTGARLVTTYDLGKSLVAYAGYPKEQVGYDSQGNFGGELSFYDDEIKIMFIPAVHSSAVTYTDPDTESEQPEYGGNPGGFLIAIKDGPSIYHTGDTDVFGDMAMLNNKVDVMLACIGDHFTMGPYRAAKAVSLVRPEIVIPMHYGTFPVLNGTSDAFEHELFVRDISDKLKIIQPGETFEY